MANSNTMEADRKSFALQIIPVMLCFFVMGFVDLVGAASNFVQKDLGLTDSQANLFPSLVFFWFLIFSVPTGMLMNRIGRKNTVLLSIGITSLSLIVPLFGDGYSLMLISFSLLGIGNAVMQTSLNPLVSNLISGERLASTLTFGQFVKAIASFLAPLLMAWGAAALFPTFGLGWRAIFAIYAAVSLLSVCLLAATPINEERPDKASGVMECLRLLGRPFILLCFLGIMCHVGIDVGTNTTAPKIIIERLGLPLEEAAGRLSARLNPAPLSETQRFLPCQHMPDTHRHDDADIMPYSYMALYRHHPHRTRQLQCVLHNLLSGSYLHTQRAQRSVRPYDYGTLRRHDFPSLHGLRR